MPRKAPASNPVTPPIGLEQDYIGGMITYRDLLKKYRIGNHRLNDYIELYGWKRTPHRHDPGDLEFRHVITPAGSSMPPPMPALGDFMVGVMEKSPQHWRKEFEFGAAHYQGGGRKARNREVNQFEEPGRLPGWFSPNAFDD